MEKLYISGTGTEIGKTHFSAWLARELSRQGKRVKYIKPVQTGYPADDDAAFVRRHAGLSEDDARVLFTGEEPVAPCFLWETFPLDGVLDAINKVRDCDVLLVEGAGGLLVPLDKKRRSYEIAELCGLETVIVVPNALGCLSDAQLNGHFLATSGIPFKGFALNNHFAQDETNRERNHAMLAHLMPGSIRWVFGSL
ncbi:dethiobiotin synthase [Salidesulfovibrio onnuriiensis]|uniref:dethiobiotin synthase n=1 Tax=Salidesulfovibrio onnuriiensis TaxID=2583823 RepID=UPI0011C77A58|nr:dethiobiotin synthase [Salidesulfovibrio onnuriiensis]